MGNAAGVVSGCQPEHCGDACRHSYAESVSHASMLGQQLLSASRDGDLVTVRVCLASGTDVDVRQPLKLLTMDRYDQGERIRQAGFTPLMYAVQAGNMRIVQALLDARARVNAKDEDGTTPVHLAAASGELGILNILIQAGARTETLDEDGKGVLDYLPEEIQCDAMVVRRWREKLEAAAAEKAAGNLLSGIHRGDVVKP